MTHAPPRTRILGLRTEIAQVAVRRGFGYFLEWRKLTDLEHRLRLEREPPK